MKRYINSLILGIVLAIPVVNENLNAWNTEGKIEVLHTYIEYPTECHEIQEEEVEPEIIDLPEVVCEKPYTDEDLELLAHLLNGESGADWCSDEMVYGVGSVALNRVNSSEFPDTLEEVIYQPGQYACVNDGNFEKEPSERCYQIAEELLLNGSVFPEDVVFQAEFRQGSEVYSKVQNMYFCRM